MTSTVPVKVFWVVKKCTPAVQYLSATLHSITTQKTSTWIFTAMETSNLAWLKQCTQSN